MFFMDIQYFIYLCVTTWEPNTHLVDQFIYLLSQSSDNVMLLLTIIFVCLTSTLRNEIDEILSKGLSWSEENSLKC